jgi:hypothetical protein
MPPSINADEVRSPFGWLLLNRKNEAATITARNAHLQSHHQVRLMLFFPCQLTRQKAWFRPQLIPSSATH